MITEKQCTKCKETKPVEEFSKRSKSKDGFGYTCKECDKASAKASYERRKEKIKSREYYEKNKDAHRARVKKNYEENKDRYREHHKKYREQNPEVQRRASQKRQEQLSKVKREKYARQDVIDRDSINGVPYCQICKQPIMDINDVQVDHIIPIVMGGPDIMLNLRTVHRKCNIERPKDGSDLHRIPGIAE